ncbi:hypothetical protein JBE27_39060 [Streptomyces albiflaviniger]|nr:hypothetical protein [Streptomyces albiflaviniger]
MRHRRHSTTVRTGLLAFRAARGSVFVSTPPHKPGGSLVFRAPVPDDGVSGPPSKPLPVETAGHGHRQGRG